MTEWLRAIVHDREPNAEGRAAAEWIAETLIDQRLFFEALKRER